MDKNYTLQKFLKNVMSVCQELHGYRKSMIWEEYLSWGFGKGNNKC